MDDTRIGMLTARASDFVARSPGGASGMHHIKVLDFYHGRALLDVDGNVVSAESEVPLKRNAEYDVMVKGVDGGKVQLQIVGPGRESPIRPMTDSALSSRFMSFDIPVTETSLQVGRSLMREGLPVTKQNVLDVLTNLPSQPARNEIDFLVALLREELPLSREALDLIPTLARDTARMPDAAKAMFEWALSDPDAAAQPGPPPLVPETGLLRTLAALIAMPDAEGTDALKEKIAALVKNFLQPTEARLAAAAELVPTPSIADASHVAALGNRLLELLTISEQTNAREMPLTRDALNILANLRDIPLPSVPPAPETASFAAVRDDAVSQGNAALASGAALQDKQDALRAATLNALSRLFETLAASRGTDAEDAPATLPPGAFKLPQQLDAATQRMTLLQSLLERGDMNDPAVRQAVQRLASDLLPLLTLRPPADTAPEVNRFLDDSARWLAQLLKTMQTPEPKAETPHAPPPPEIVSQGDKLLLQMRSAAFQQEVRSLAEGLREFPDARALAADAARPAATQPGQFSPQAIAAQFSRAMESAALSNLLLHDGKQIMDAMVTAFPIRIGNRVEIGLLKVFRERDREGKTKKLDPENASLVLILNTEFLGTSLVHIHTYRKGLNCTIEVENARKKKTLDKFLNELTAALKETPFDLRNVSVRVKRKEKKPAGLEEEKETKKPTTIDLSV